MNNKIIEKSVRLCYDEIVDSYLEKNSWLLECSKGHKFRLNSNLKLEKKTLKEQKCPTCTNIEIFNEIPTISTTVEEAIAKIDLQTEKGKKILTKDINITEFVYESWHNENLAILNCIFIKHPLISPLLNNKEHEIKVGVAETIDMKLKRIKANIRNELNKLDLIKITIKDLIQER
jgi:hypothetical protein